MGRKGRPCRPHRVFKYSTKSSFLLRRQAELEHSVVVVDYICERPGAAVMEVRWVLLQRPKRRRPVRVILEPLRTHGLGAHLRRIVEDPGQLAAPRRQRDVELPIGAAVQLCGAARTGPPPLRQATIGRNEQPVLDELVEVKRGE